MRDLQHQMPDVNPQPSQSAGFRVQESVQAASASWMPDNDGSMQVGLIDSNAIGPSPWAIRDDSHFSGKAFADLKQSISESCGNVQPIIVLPVGSSFEIVSGHRRHRACLELELKVFAVVLRAGVNSLEIIEKMHLENRNRVEPSHLEKARHYKRLLDEKVFASRRMLAERMKMTHAWMNKLIALAELPAEVIDAFSNPHLLQPAQASELAAAIAHDRAAVLSRAREFVEDGPRRAQSPTATVVRCLLGLEEDANKWAPLIELNPRLGRWRRRLDGRIEIVATCDDPTDMLERVRLALSGEGYRRAAD